MSAISNRGGELVVGSARAVGDRSRRRGALASSLLAAAVALASGTALVMSPGSGSVAPFPQRAAAAALPGALSQREGRSRLSLADQGQISAALGAEQRVYRVSRAADGTLVSWSPSAGLRASFGGAGVVLSTGAVRVGLGLRSLGYGSALAPVAAVAPLGAGNRALYAHPGVGEWYVNGPLGLEQGFTVDRPPAADVPGPLTLAVALSGDAHAALSGDAIVFTHGGSSIRYAGLSVTDSAGRTLHSWLALRRGQVLIGVETRGARFPLRVDPLLQQGNKLAAPEGEIGKGQFGWSVALSADGNTALIGGPTDNGGIGAAWPFTRSAGVWKAGAKLTGSGEAGKGQFGTAVALSSDGNTAVIGGPADAESIGAAWAFTRSGSTWTQQGGKLTGSGETGKGYFGDKVALSGNGARALIGAPIDNPAESGRGAAFAFNHSGSTWSQEAKLIGGGAEIGAGVFGSGVALSADGNTALVGAPNDSPGGVYRAGAVWAFSRKDGWTQVGEPLTVGEGEVGYFGVSVSLSGDGNTGLIGGGGGGVRSGAAWVFVNGESGWTQQAKITGEGENGEDHFGDAVALSEDGTAALVGGFQNNKYVGAAWEFTHTAFGWSQLGEMLTVSGEVGGEAGQGRFGESVAISRYANTALIGGPGDNGEAGAAWPFVSSTPAVTGVSPSRGLEAGGQVGVNTVTITGTDLSGASAVKFGAAPAKSFTVESSETIKASAPAGKGTVDVRVTTPEGSSAVVAGDRYTYVPPEVKEEEEAAVEAASGVPTLTSVSPNSSPLAGETVTLTGANFTEVEAVEFGSKPAVSFKVNSTTSISAVVPAIEESETMSRPFAKIRTKKAHAKIRARKGLTTAVRADNEFTYVAAPPVPSVTAISPKKGSDAGGEQITLTGSGFAGVSAVRFGSKLATQIHVLTETSLTVMAPPQGEGKADVTVTTPGGTSPSSSKARFKYGKPNKPIVEYVSPASGSTSGGSKVTLAGTNFASGMTFRFGKAVVAGENCISTSCTVISPAGRKPGVVDVTGQLGKSKGKKNPPADRFTYQ
jgi:hypothetical protein